MTDSPLGHLTHDLGSRLNAVVHVDRVLGSGTGTTYEIKPSEFVEIRHNPHPRTVAFVDGGQGPLDEAPNYIITLNRVYCSLFCGEQRVQPRSNHRIQFLSYVMATAGDAQKDIRYSTRLFAYDAHDMDILPSESDMASVVQNTTILRDSKINSPARRFAEWSLAARIVDEELDRGDILVMDGSLQTEFKNETQYSNRLYDMAVSKDVIICGLSKTSRLLTESGDSLISRISHIAKKVPFGTWYVKVADMISADDRGVTLAIKLHPTSKFVYRFEILREQFAQMSADDINSILGSLAANSQDMAMPGYPYGAIDADRFAQVRMEETRTYRAMLLTERLTNKSWPKSQDSQSINAHDILNMVTS